MKQTTELTKKVLEFLEPDSTKWAYWTSRQTLNPISESECIEKFKTRILNAVSNSEKVIVAGDYDCDGISATTIMVSGLRKLGLECGFYIPDRIKEGYGLSETTVKLAYKKGYSLIVTVDNGIKSAQALSLAKELGMDVIVTDHHTMDEEVNCDIVVHPMLMEPCFKTLCGAGIAYECMRVLDVDDDYLLQLAGLASISDMMVVKGQTRALIQNGLNLMNKTHEKHIFSLATDRELNEKSIGFQVVPKLNAIGRLSNLANANNVVRYFLAHDDESIYSLGQQITQINMIRKQMSDQMQKTALLKCKANEDIYIIEDTSFHEGIIGLVAGSLCSRFNKPCIVLAKNEQGYKASMRSPEGFNCMDFLGPYEHFVVFGGHENAAGFSLNLNEFDMFEDFIHTRIKEYTYSVKTKKTLIIDDEELSLETIQSLDLLRPFGPGFDFPSFEIVHPKVKSLYDFQNHKHRKYTLESGLQCMRFNQSDSEYKKSVNSIYSFIGTVQINQYQGRKQVNFVIDEIVYA